jgi:hypothetical protein
MAFKQHSLNKSRAFARKSRHSKVEHSREVPCSDSKAICSHMKQRRATAPQLVSVGVLQERLFTKTSFSNTIKCKVQETAVESSYSMPKKGVYQNQQISPCGGDPLGHDSLGPRRRPIYNAILRNPFRKIAFEILKTRRFFNESFYKAGARQMVDKTLRGNCAAD